MRVFLLFSYHRHTGETMGLEEKLLRLHEHVEEHPTDYQSVIAELKLHSKFIEQERKQIENAKLKRVAEIRKERREYEESKQRNG